MNNRTKRFMSKIPSIIISLLLILSLLGSFKWSTTAQAASNMDLSVYNTTLEVGVGKTIVIPSLDGPNNFKSSNPKIASVTNEGIVTGISEGTTKIKAYTRTGLLSLIGLGRLNTTYTVIVKNTVSYTVSFDTNGGSEVPIQITDKGNVVTRPSDPIKEGYEFAGWYINSNLRTKYYFDEAVNDNITLYAKWNVLYTDGHSPLDEEEQDVEIYSFDLDCRKIEVNKSTEVTFVSKIFYNVELEDSDVQLYEDDKLIGYLHDDGVDGDKDAYDNFFTGKFTLSSNVETQKNYYVVVKKVESEQIIIKYYMPLTDEQISDITLVNAKMTELMSSDFYKALNNDEKMQQVSTLLIQCEKEGLIEKNSIHSDSKHYVFTYKYSCGLNGYVIVYSSKDSDIILNSNIQSNLANEMMARSNFNDSENLTVTIFCGFEDVDYRRDFYNDLELQWEKMGLNTEVDTEVTVEDMHNLNTHGDAIVLSLHGAHDDKYDFLVLNEEYSTSKLEKYINYGDIGLAQGENGTTFAIPSDFILNAYNSTALDNMIIYSEACGFYGCDCKSTTIDRTFANAFIEKSAEVVIGYHNLVEMNYSRNLMKYTLEKSFAGKTFEKSLEEATSVYGVDDNTQIISEDKFIAYPVITGNENYIFRVTGGVAGTVRDAKTGLVLEKATVRIYDNTGNEVSSAITDNRGYYKIKLPDGEYILKVSVAQYRTSSISLIVNNGQITYVENLMLVNIGLSSGYANGIITNALTGVRVGNVTINVRRGANNTSGKIVSTVLANGYGYYELTTDDHVYLGYYTLELSKSGFATTYKNIVVAPMNAENQNATISPEGTEDIYRIVLTWGLSPRDMDSHVYGTTSEGKPFHVYFGNQNAKDASVNICSLDLDDTSSYGPETITLIPTNDTPLYYYVHQFSSDGTMSTSGSKVTVYKGNTLVREYNVPVDQGDDIYWNVFAIVNGEIIESNTVSNSVDITYANPVSLFMLMSELEYEGDLIYNCVSKDNFDELEVEEIITDEINEEEITSDEMTVANFDDDQESSDAENKLEQ